MPIGFPRKLPMLTISPSHTADLTACTAIMSSSSEEDEDWEDADLLAAAKAGDAAKVVKIMEYLGYGDADPWSFWIADEEVSVGTVQTLVRQLS